jgi:hypothetical protein
VLPEERVDEIGDRLEHSPRETFRRLIQETKGARGSVVVKALSYKPEGRGVASR